MPTGNDASPYPADDTLIGPQAGPARADVLSVQEGIEPPYPAFARMPSPRRGMAGPSGTAQPPDPRPPAPDAPCRSG
jgi:hypothetical protein